MGTWLNSDGLYIRLGRDEGVSTTAGTYPTMVAGQHVTELRIPAMTALGTSPAIMANSTIIPAGATIARVEVVAETACTSGGSAALNVGLIRLDRSTELDYDGLVAALALTALDANGETTSLVEGSTSHGALIGTKLANAGLLTADYDTAAYTAGEVVVRVYWYKD